MVPRLQWSRILHGGFLNRNMIMNWTAGAEHMLNGWEKRRSQEDNYIRKMSGKFWFLHVNRKDSHWPDETWTFLFSLYFPFFYFTKVLLSIYSYLMRYLVSTASKCYLQTQCNTSFNVLLLYLISNRMRKGKIFATKIFTYIRKIC